MGKQPLKIYVDTSVFGGVFDKEFAEPSRTFFKQVRLGYFDIITSVIVQDEIRKAPENIQCFFKTTSEGIEVLELTEESARLRRF